MIGKILALAMKLNSMGVAPLDAVEHATIAVSVSTHDVSPELILAIARVESHFDPTATSYVAASGRRSGGNWRSLKPAGRGPRFCGVMQTIAKHSWRRCLAQRDLTVGYATGVDEIRRWLRVTRGDVRAALRGHGCGYPGLKGICRRYDQRVLRVMRRLSS